MNSILKLQTLQADANDNNGSMVFISAISVICPVGDVPQVG